MTTMTREIRSLATLLGLDAPTSPYRSALLDAVGSMGMAQADIEAAEQIDKLSRDKQKLLAAVERQRNAVAENVVLRELVNRMIALASDWDAHPGHVPCGCAACDEIRLLGQAPTE